MGSTAILFPGQGSLTPDAAAQARSAWPELVERASELVGDDPFARAADSTRYAQPAVFVASLAGWRERAIDMSEVCALAGHSLGELSALVAAGALSTEHGLELVVLRSRLMDEAAQAAPPGGMVALLGGDPSLAGEVASRHGLVIANDNAPGQLVFSGPRAAVERIIPAARSAGFKTMALDVTGAFHSPAVAAAEAPFRAALNDAAWRPAAVPVVSGLMGRPFEDFPLELARALVRPVRWRAVMAALVDLGAREFVDIGPGRVLAKLAKRNVRTEEGDVVAV